MHQLDFTDKTMGVFAQQVMLGLVRGYSGEIKFGESAIGTTPSDIWDGGGLYVWPTAAEQLRLASSSALDTALGTGARSVKVFGLDANWLPISETIPLSGTSPASSTQSFLRVVRMYVYSAGSTSTAQGIISCTNVSGLLLARILVGNNQTLMSIFSVPDNRICMINSWMVATDKGKEVHFTAKSRNNYNGVIWRTRKTARLYQAALTEHFPVPYVLGPRTDLRVEAFSDVPGADCHCEWSMWLIDTGQADPDFLAALKL